MMKKILLSILLFTSLFSWGQSADTLLFRNEGDKIVYQVNRDEKAQKGTLSDALQNVPGLKVDTEGNITLRGVSKVEVWINDHPSYFEEESQKNYLQQTSASIINRIEVITNPSSRYTKETDTGIINVIIDSKNFHSQNLIVGFQANTSPNLSPWISYDWNNEKFSFNASVKGNFSKTNSVTNSYSISFDSISLPDNSMVWDTTRHYINTSHSNEEENSVDIFLKMDYRFNKKNSLMAFFSIAPSTSQRFSVDTTYRKEFVNSIGTYHSISSTEGGETFFWGSAGVFFQHLFDREGETFSFSADSDFDKGKTKSSYIQNYQEHSSLNRNTCTRNDFDEAGWNLKAEYNLPYSKNGEFYACLSNYFKPDNNLLLFDTLGQNDIERHLDSIRSERRDFSKYISSALFIVQQNFGNFTIKPGLEFEQTHITAHYYRFKPTVGNLVKNFFFVKPSLHVSYHTQQQHNFFLSYTRKTTYPYVRYFTDRYIYEEESFCTGNPLLKPTLTDVYEAGWTKYWDKFGSATVNFYYKNFINSVNDMSELRYDSLWGRAVNFRWPVNIDSYYETGTQFNVTYRPNAMLNIRLDANLYDAQMKTIYNDSLVTDNNWAYNFKLGFWGKLWNKLEIHATAYYNSPTYTLYAGSQTAYGINCGLRADFFEKRLSLLLNANDIFNWNKEDNYTYNPNYISYSSMKMNSRYISLEAIYKLL